MQLDDFIKVSTKDGDRYVRRDNIVGINTDPTREKFFVLVTPQEKIAVVGLTWDELQKLLFVASAPELIREIANGGT